MSNCVDFPDAVMSAVILGLVPRIYRQKPIERQSELPSAWFVDPRDKPEDDGGSIVHLRWPTSAAQKSTHFVFGAA